MHDRLRRRQQRMGILLLTNLLVAVIAPRYYQLLPSSLAEAALAFLAGAVILTVVDRSYGRYLWFASVFAGYLAWQIILSNIRVAWLVLQPTPRLDPGIIAIPLRLETGLETITLASAITLTPGTLSVDLGRDEQGRRVLYVHALVVQDPERLRSSITKGFEQMILSISQGAMR